MFEVRVNSNNHNSSELIGRFDNETDAAVCVKDFNDASARIKQLLDAADIEYETEEAFQAVWRDYTQARDRFQEHFGVSWVWTHPSPAYFCEIKSKSSYEPIRWIKELGG